MWSRRWHSSLAPVTQHRFFPLSFGCEGGGEIVCVVLVLVLVLVLCAVCCVLVLCAVWCVLVGGDRISW